VPDTVQILAVPVLLRQLKLGHTCKHVRACRLSVFWNVHWQHSMLNTQSKSWVSEEKVSRMCDLSLREKDLHNPSKISGLQKQVLYAPGPLINLTCRIQTHSKNRCHASALRQQ